MSTRFCQLFRKHRVVVSWICLLLGIRLLAAIRHRYDIDEAQNLHLVYGWLIDELGLATGTKVNVFRPSNAGPPGGNLTCAR